MEKPLVSKELLDYIFSNYTETKLLEQLDNLLTDNTKSFSYNLAEYVSNYVESQFDGNYIERNFQVDKDHYNPWKEYLLARLASSNGYYEAAVKKLDKIVGNMAYVDPALLLQRARLLLRIKEIKLAIHDVKTALLAFPEYPLFVKAEKIIKKIIDSQAWKPRRALKIALLGSNTTVLLAPVLQAVCFREDIKAHIYQGSYGNYHQEILNPKSGLYDFSPDVVIIVPNRSELGAASYYNREQAAGFANELKSLWDVLQSKNPCHIIQVGLDAPAYGAWASLEDSMVNGKARVVNTINDLLAGYCGQGVSFLDINKLARQTGQQFYSALEWYTAKQFPASAALPLFADFLTAQIKAAYGLTAKALIVDLDNTLWGGVVGEDGLGGIVVGPPSPAGEAFQDLQYYLKQLKERGILLIVCSKNNLDDAELPFKQHDSMILKLEDFVLFRANWQDKATNIKEIAETLSLGLDSFVFLDDNPMERAWVRAKLPQVIVPECGNKPWEMVAVLNRGMYFESISLTTEDKKRHESYKANIERQEFKKNIDSLEDFLIGLDMSAECGPIDASTLTRATQLINKTNQFNVTTKRYSEEQIKEMTESPAWWTRWYRLKDRFGDHGLIGIIVAKKEYAGWYIDTWLMSCRVLGRQMEQFMCRDLLKTAQQSAVHRVYGQYFPTAKNVLVKDLYKQLGFAYDEQLDRYYYDLTAKPLPECNFIKERKKD